MFKLSSQYVATVLILLAAVDVSVAQTADDPATVDRATTILSMFLDGKFDAFVATGNVAVQAQFSAAQAKAIKTQFDAQYGKLDGFKEVSHRRIGKVDAVTFELLYERNKVKLVIAVDADNKLSGFRITGVESRASYQVPSYVDPSKFHEEKATIVTSDFELPGTLTIPTGKGLFAGLVLVHGSGPHDEDESVQGNKPFRDLALGLASRGVVVLRYEKRTHKYGDQVKPEDITLEWETIDDAVSAAKVLRDRSEVDPNRVFVLGHSLGGMAAPYIAKRDPKLAGIVILAGNARPLLDLVEEQLTYISKSDGQVSNEEAAMIKQVGQAIALIRAGKIDEPGASLLGAPLSYWADLNNRKQVAIAQALDCPILVIQGGRDYQVTTKCFEVWKAGLSGKPNVSFKLYESLNHLMIAGEGPSTPKEYSKTGHVDQRVIDDIAAWITAN